MQSDKLFQIVKKTIDKIDVYCLLASGCPQDEFDKESQIITARLQKGMTAHDIAEIVAQVMSEQFDDEFWWSEFIPYVKEIEQALNEG